MGGVNAYWCIGCLIRLSSCASLSRADLYIERLRSRLSVSVGCCSCFREQRIVIFVAIAGVSALFGNERCGCYECGDNEFHCVVGFLVWGFWGRMFVVVYVLILIRMRCVKLQNILFIL